MIYVGLVVNVMVCKMGVEGFIVEFLDKECEKVVRILRVFCSKYSFMVVFLC